jgi:hypothetical protein
LVFAIFSQGASVPTIGDPENLVTYWLFKAKLFKAKKIRGTAPSSVHSIGLIFANYTFHAGKGSLTSAGASASHHTLLNHGHKERNLSELSGEKGLDSQ